MFQLITEAVVPQQHADWSSSGPDESCSMELLSAFPPFLSACGQPAYTNYVGGFHGCLDYIFIQPDRMQVLILAKGAPPNALKSVQQTVFQIQQITWLETSESGPFSFCLTQIWMPEPKYLMALFILTLHSGIGLTAPLSYKHDAVLEMNYYRRHQY